MRPWGFMPIPTDEERVGTLVTDRYRLEEILGRGGMGVVYAGAHVLTGRRVAVKLLKREYADDLGGVRRFLQEARAAASLEHPQIIDVLDVGTDEDGTVFMALERLDGETLGERIDRVGAMPLEEVIELALSVMTGLEAAHAGGILHRDLKPDNIFLSVDGSGRAVPKILDFGMSKVLGESFGNTTDSGTLLATPYYMSPEQAEGAKDLGPQTDVWSLGAVLYHALSGERPFQASNPPTLLLRIARGEFEPLARRSSRVPRGVAEVIDRALALDRSERWLDVRS
ncbi:MAG TPA: serine/threonine protein kinase, partial [Myxococcales bacterium]|nr:serine/threonine protein kinase [Myxococcales bacterium]